MPRSPKKKSSKIEETPNVQGDAENVIIDDMVTSDDTPPVIDRMSPIILGQSPNATFDSDVPRPISHEEVVGDNNLNTTDNTRTEMEVVQIETVEPIDESDLNATEEILETSRTFNDITTPIFNLQPISFLHNAAEIFEFNTNESDRICTVKPEGIARDVKCATFLVDLSTVEPRTLTRDMYGIWGNSSGNKGYFIVDKENKTVVKVKDNTKYDWHIQRLRWLHQDTDGKFTKTIYRGIDPRGRELWALISYEWKCEPYDFVPRRNHAMEVRNSPYKVEHALPTSGASRTDSAIVADDLSSIEHLNDQLPSGVVLFSTKAVHSMAAAAIITQFQVDSDRICTVRPTFIPVGTQCATFVVDLSHLPSPRDMSCDKYGKWGNSSGLKSYFKVNMEERAVQKTDPCLENFDIIIQRLKYLHPDTNQQFSRTIYWQMDAQGSHNLAVLSYEWKCEPFEFMPSAHGNAVKKSGPYIRTTPSVMEQVRDAVTKYKPNEVYQSILDQAGEVLSEGPEVPRDVGQIRNMARRTLGAMGSDRKRRQSQIDPTFYYSPCSGTINQKNWRELVRRAKDVGKRGQIAEFPGEDDLYIVMVDRTSHTVHRTAEADFSCMCSDYETYRYICQHTLASARLENVDALFVEKVREKFEQEQSESGRIRDGSLKFMSTPLRQKARKSIRKAIPHQVTAVNMTVDDVIGPIEFCPPIGALGGLSLPSERAIEMIQFKKPPTYTQPYHNDKPFSIVFLQEYLEEIEQKECQHCQVSFPQMALVMAPEDIAITHDERFPAGESGRFGSTMKVQLVHARYSCLVQRYPYFYTGLLQVSHSTRVKLSVEHRKHLQEQFGVNLDLIQSS